jgi:proline dehydrogenase
MKKSSQPTDPMIKKLEELADQYLEGRGRTNLDFTDTKIAFEYKTDRELKKSTWLFSMMNKAWLVKLGSKLAMLGIKLRLPFVNMAIKNTIFSHFCGGTTLLESQHTIEVLAAHNVHTVLDYGVEAKQTEEDFNATMNEALRGIEFASQNESVNFVSSKITGLARFTLLEKIHRGETLTKEEEEEYQNVMKRIDAMCHKASELGVRIFFDAEESWIQKPLDDLINQMMERYNKEKVVVYNTFQLYLTDRLPYLKESYKMATEKGYLLGAKLVRGAYMEKERNRAAERGYPSPVQPDFQATNDAYNAAVRFCVENYESMASCNASHNEYSNKLQADLMTENDIPKNHPHLMFAQLYGMSDNLSFNLAKAGYRVAKYVVYGPVRDVVPYLLRRAEENTSVTGDMTREYGLLVKEMKRRGIK